MTIRQHLTASWRKAAQTPFAPWWLRYPAFIAVGYPALPSLAGSVIWGLAVAGLPPQLAKLPPALRWVLVISAGLASMIYTAAFTPPPEPGVVKDSWWTLLAISLIAVQLSDIQK